MQSFQTRGLCRYHVFALYSASGQFCRNMKILRHLKNDDFGATRAAADDGCCSALAFCSDTIITTDKLTGREQDLAVSVS